MRRRLPTLLLALVVVGFGALPAAATAAPRERTFTFRAGPYVMGGYRTQFIKERVRSPRETGFVTRMHASLVDARGRPVTIRDGMLHHVFFNNLAVMRVAGHCTARQPEVFYSTGEEDETLLLPRGYGYRVRTSHRWRMSGMLMSHRLQARKVFVRYTVRVSRARGLTAVRPLWVRANGCGPSSSYGVRGDGGPGSVDDRIEHWSVPLSGRIVAAGGHLHGGAIGLQMRQPACGDRLVYDNVPHYAPANALVYTARPMLHEAGPVNTSWWSSRTGVGVRQGDVLDLHGLYDGSQARGAVMAITHVYIAADASERGGCAPLPADARATEAPPGTRPSAPYEPIPLWKLDERGRPVELGEPEAPAVAVAGGTPIAVRTAGFSPENVVVHTGDLLRWRFADAGTHNLTFASGPRVIAGQTGTQGQEATTQFDAPGRYQLFCYLHPMTMREQVTVLPREGP
jgi:plastocyanin